MLVKDSAGNTMMVDGTPVTNNLPVGVYTLMHDERADMYYLNDTDDFKIPDKVYGNDEKLIDRWIKKYNSIDRNLGILLTGLKGSGKTVTAKMLCIKSGLPVIIIPKMYYGPSFVSFMTNPELGNCAVFIDEFEKIWSCASGSEYESSSSMSELLRMLDGTYNTHNLFIFTTNSSELNGCLINRPSRIFYRKDYGSLSNEIITEVAQDLMKNKDYIDDLIQTCTLFSSLSFDILCSIINESNTFDELPSECVKYMNFIREEMPIRIYQRIYGNTYADSTSSRYLNFFDDASISYIKYSVEPGTSKIIGLENMYSHVSDLDFKSDGVVGEYTFVDDSGTEFLIKRTTYSESICQNLIGGNLGNGRALLKTSEINKSLKEQGHFDQSENLQLF